LICWRGELALQLSELAGLKLRQPAEKLILGAELLDQLVAEGYPAWT
jgi:hypothetical protein